jgi:hypothetical protein
VSAAVYIKAGSASVVNDGSMSGQYGVYLQVAGTVENAGTITGSSYAVFFQNSNIGNTLKVDPGAVFNGSVDGKGGTLELAAGNGGSIIPLIDSTSFDTFSTLTVDANGHWTLTGSHKLANGVTDNGTLVINGTLDVASATGAGDFVFQGASELLIDQPASVGPQLQDFIAGDSVDIKNFSGTVQYVSQTGVLTLSNGATLDFDTTTLGSGTPQAASDGSGGIRITLGNTAPAITLLGFKNGAILDTQTTQPFQTVTVSDSIGSSDRVSATIAFTAANGTLSGAGQGAVSGGTVTYSLSATDPGTLQNELRALTFTPTLHQGGAGTTVTTAFDLTVSDNVPANTVSDSSTKVVVTETSTTTIVSVQTFLNEQSSLDALPNGFSISDTASNVANALNQLNADPHINSIGLTDNGTPTLTLSVAQAGDTTALGKINSPYTITISDTAANIQNLAPTQIKTLEAHFHLTQITENFADGAYTVAHFNARRETYEDIYNSAKQYVATAENNAKSGTLLVYASGLTMTASRGSETIEAGSDTFAVTPHARETTTIKNGKSNETFVCGGGFGHDTINGFLAATTSHDLLQFSTSMFRGLPYSHPATQRQQAADALALLNHHAFGTANTTITDRYTDTLTLDGVAIATLKAHLGDFKFT